MPSHEIPTQNGSPKSKENLLSNTPNSPNVVLADKRTDSPTKVVSLLSQQTPPETSALTSNSKIAKPIENNTDSISDKTVTIKQDALPINVVSRNELSDEQAQAFYGFFYAPGIQVAFNQNALKEAYNIVLQERPKTQHTEHSPQITWVPPVI